MARPEQYGAHGTEYARVADAVYGNQRECTPRAMTTFQPPEDADLAT
jgi:hypothetical protein